VSPAREEELPPEPRLGGVHEVAREEHDTERSIEVEALDVGEHRLGSTNVRQHLFGLIDRDDGVTERKEAVRDPAGSASELEDRFAGGHAVVHELRLAERCKDRVEADGTAVRSLVPRAIHGNTVPSFVCVIASLRQAS
jgi:hypothetical protein